MKNKIYASTSSKISQREIDNSQLARSLAGECVVLLKNDGALPLGKGIPVALYGNGARNTIKGGTGSGDVNTRDSVNIESGLKQAGYTITTTDWIERNENARAKAKNDFLKWAHEESIRTGKEELYVIFDHPFEEPDILEITDDDIAASKTDTALFVISRNSGEGADRRNAAGDYQLNKNETGNLKKIAGAYKKVVVILNVGGLLQMAEVQQIKGISAIVLMNQLGNLGGLAIADILSGDKVPSGKLADSWAKDYMDYPSSADFSFNNGNVDDDWYKEGIYVGYRYFDSFKKEVVYPFGYGLSYTDFSIETTGVKQNSSKLIISADVTNTGTKYSGKEVVQVYISAPAGKLDKPYQELKGFVKTPELKPGEKKTVLVEIPISNLASYSEEISSWIIEKGTYIVRVGNSSRATQAVAAITFSQDFVTEKCQNVFKPDSKIDQIKPDSALISAITEKNAAELKSVKWTIDVDTTKLISKTNTYSSARRELISSKTEKLTLEDVKNGKCTLEEFTAQLTVEEMAVLCVGVFNKEIKESVIGAASACVPGAAGETPDFLSVSRKIKALILADGPAGLRLLPHFITDENDKRLPGGDIFGDSITPFPEKLPEGTKHYYQYCTAIPIGWALSQSWNCELVSEIGKMIGSEMELFGVDLWLAPAQNIHRNPLCGRNFEYYSEDPLLTGKISAAMTNGVQTVKGRGTTIKHFAANNQEENRYFTNAHIAERTIREIYLKGFEIAVKESQPLSVMTSYNLLNGIHTANNYDLCQKVLRDEWGFNGVVMTDWYTSQNLPGLTGKYKPKYPISASTGCIAAGNDLQMPGCQKNIDDIVQAVSTGKELDGYKITKADLQFCTKNFLKVVLKLM